MLVVCRGLAHLGIAQNAEDIEISNDSFIGWYPIMVVIDEVASALKMDRDVLVSG